MSLPLSATISFENGIPVVVYNKATTYYTKIGGDRLWQTNNWYGIKGSTTDTNLIRGSLGIITFEDNTAFQCWSSDVVGQGIQGNNVNSYLFATIDISATWGDAFSAFMAESNIAIDLDKWISNVNIALAYYYPSNPPITANTNTGPNSIPDYGLTQIGLHMTLTGTGLNVDSPYGTLASSSTYFSRGVVTQPLGYILSGIHPNEQISIALDWNEVGTEITATVGFAGLFFAAADAAGWVANLLVGRIVPALLAIGSGGTAVVGTQLVQQGESVLPTTDSVIVSVSDSIPLDLIPDDIEYIEGLNLQKLAPNFANLTISEQASLLADQMQLLNNGGSTTIQFVGQVMNTSYVIPYVPNAPIPMQLLNQVDQAGRSLLEWQTANGGTITLTPP